MKLNHPILQGSRSLTPLLSLFILGLLFVSCSGGSEDQPAQQQGPGLPMGENDVESIIQQATFQDLDGESVTLENFRGKVVVIDFWETWCGPCLQVFPSLNQLREEYPDQFEVLAVTLGMVEGPEEARAFRDEHGYDFTWLYDANNVSDQLGIHSIPFKLYFDQKGELIKYELGSRGSEGDYESARAVIEEYAENL